MLGSNGNCLNVKRSTHFVVKYNFDCRHIVNGGKKVLSSWCNILLSFIDLSEYWGIHEVGLSNENEHVMYLRNSPALIVIYISIANTTRTFYICVSVYSTMQDEK